MNSKARPVLVCFLALLAGDAAAQWANPNPSEANIRYPRGEAPFHARIGPYARQLEHFIERRSQPALQDEMNALGVNFAQLEVINGILARHREREQQARAEHWRQACIPMLRGDQLTEAQARVAFEWVDDDTWREAVVEQVLGDIAKGQGATIADKVRERIDVYGEAVQFSTSQFAKVIELGRGGLFVSHMMIECGTHPDYPRR